MRRSLLLTVLVAATLVLAIGCGNKPPKIPAKPTGPTTVAINTANEYRSVTTDPNKDKILYVFDWRDAKADTTALLASGDTAKASHTWADTGMYAVRVKAKDEKNAWSSDWSDTLMVHVMTSVLNNPPAQPAKPTHAGNPWVDSVQYFTSSTTDPDFDSIQIKFYFDEGQVSNYSPRVACGASVTDSVWYQARGWKAVHAVAMDAKGDTSIWSPPCSVYVDAPNVAPYAPSIITSFCPKRGIAGGPQYKFFANARHEYGDSVRYVFYFDNDSVTSALFGSGVNGYVSWQPTGDTHTYVVKVKAVSQTGLANDTMPETSFATVGEGTVIWGMEEDFYASPALGTVKWNGLDELASICGSREGILHIIDAYQSNVLYPIAVTDPDDYQSSPAIGADGSIYVGNENGAVYAFSNDGELKWSFGSIDTGLAMSASPALGNGGIYCGGEDKKLHKLIDNGATVTEAWSYALRNEMTSSPVVTAAGKIVCCDDSSYVYSINDDGTLDWDINTSDTTGITSSPAIASDGSIFVGTEGGRLLCIRGNSVSWRFVTDPRAAISSSPVIGTDGNVWFTADDGKLYRLDAATGDTVPGWPKQISLASMSCTPLICADNIIYVTDDDEILHAVNMSDGTIRWSAPLLVPMKKGNGHPRRFSLDLHPSAVVDQYGIIYITTASGTFAVAGRLGGTLAATDWPMFRRDVRHTGKFGGRR